MAWELSGHGMGRSMRSRASRFSAPFGALLGSLFFLPLSAGAESALRELYQGARAQAMGGAFVAVADDEQAIFMNPAGLAGIQKHRLSYIAGSLEVAQDVVGSLTSLSSFGGGSGDSINALMGKDIYGRAQVAPSFVMPGFGVSILVDGQTAVLARNKALPNIVIGYQTTNGVQVGYGLSLGRKGRRGSASGGDFRIGVAGKILWRRGGYRTVGLTEMLNLSEDALQSLAGEYGRGIGFDAGMQYLIPINSRLTASAGVAMTEIGGITFTSAADPQPSNLSAGMAFKYTLPRAQLTLAYDYRNILALTDWRKRSHLGFEAQLPVLSLYAGLNQGYLTYGFSFDAWLMKVTAVSYGEEIGTALSQDPMRRYLLNLTFAFGL